MQEIERATPPFWYASMALRYSAVFWSASAIQGSFSPTGSDLRHRTPRTPHTQERLIDCQRQPLGCSSTRTKVMTTALEHSSSTSQRITSGEAVRTRGDGSFGRVPLWKRLPRTPINPCLRGLHSLPLFSEELGDLDVLLDRVLVADKGAPGLAPEQESRGGPLRLTLQSAPTCRWFRTRLPRGRDRASSKDLRLSSGHIPLGPPRLLHKGTMTCPLTGFLLRLAFLVASTTRQRAWTERIRTHVLVPRPTPKSGLEGAHHKDWKGQWLRVEGGTSYLTFSTVRGPS